jgi:ABC-type siderophore export system fused ATPase/permease subunit
MCCLLLCCLLMNVCDDMYYAAVSNSTASTCVVCLLCGVWSNILQVQEWYKLMICKEIKQESKGYSFIIKRVQRPDIKRQNTRAEIIT